MFLIGLFVIEQTFLLVLSADYLDYSVYIMQALCSKIVNATSKSFSFCHLLAYSSSLMAFSPRFTPGCNEGGWFDDVPQINNIKFS